MLVLVVEAALAGIEKTVLGVQTLQKLTARVVNCRERCEIDAAKRGQVFTRNWIQWHRRASALINAIYLNSPFLSPVSPSQTAI